MRYKRIHYKEKLKEPIIKTNGIDHIAIHTDDLERLRKFYIEILGFTPYFEVEAHSFLKSGDCQIGIIQSKKAFGVTSYIEINHIAIRAEETKESILEKLKELNIELLPRPEGLGWDTKEKIWRGIYFFDPDRNIIQLIPKDEWPQVTRFSGEIHL